MIAVFWIILKDGLDRGTGQQQIWREERELGYFLVILQLFMLFTRSLQCVASMLAGVRGKHQHCLKEIRMNIYLNLYHLTHRIHTNE